MHEALVIFMECANDFCRISIPLRIQPSPYVEIGAQILVFEVPWI